MVATAPQTLRHFVADDQELDTPSMVVDDTIVGIQAGQAAGMMTVAVSLTGNAMGLSLAEVCALPANELSERLLAIEQEFLDAGADYVITSVAELPELLRGKPFEVT